MTTKKKSDQTKATTKAPAVNDNKAVFGPLGKYAVVAVIMVSIIVTTAIMLDKQLNTVDEKIAAIETEVTEIHTIDAITADTATSNETVEIVASTSEINATKEITSAEAAPAPVAIEAAPAADLKTEQAITIATVETATPAQTNQKQPAMDNQDRIEAHKLEQKQRMAEMFARIRSLESQQLEQYKTNQDGQITRLRDHITSQQQMIDKLALRNKELFEMRAANVQRNQTNREQVLNRI